MTPRCHPEQQEDWGLSPADLERLIRSLNKEENFNGIHIKCT